MSIYYCDICNESLDSDFIDMSLDKNGSTICSTHGAERRLQYIRRGYWRYGEWSINYELAPIRVRSMDYQYYHDNHDGSNGLFGTASTISECIEMINQIEENLNET